MGKSVTVEMDEATYKQLEMFAQQRHDKLQEAITEAIKAYMVHREIYMKDPFFQIGKAGRSGLGNLAEAHDRYLYGVEDHA